jgi:hypothetical protein
VPEATLKEIDSIRAAFSDFFSGLFKPGTYDFTIFGDLVNDSAKSLKKSVEEANLEISKCASDNFEKES